MRATTHVKGPEQNPGEGNWCEKIRLGAIKVGSGRAQTIPEPRTLWGGPL